MTESVNRYHHGDLRQTLVRLALEVVDREGVDAVRMRQLARDAGVSSAAPFRHFADRPALLDAVAEQAADDLQRALDQAAVECEDALTEFRSMTVAYVRYASEHPALFDLIHARAAARAQLLGAVDDERRLKLSALICEGQNAGLIPEADPALITLTSEALTHGLARMVAERHPRVGALSSEDARRLALAATQLLQRGMGLS